MQSWTCLLCGHAWQEVATPESCPNCHALLQFGDSFPWKQDAERHLDNCACHACVNWYAGMAKIGATGFCGRCGRLMDVHVFSMTVGSKETACPVR